MAQLAPLAISMGEPAGIGPDLILQLYAQRAEYELPPFDDAYEGTPYHDFMGRLVTDWDWPG